MAGQIKGITIEFRGETTKLDKALAKIKNESKSIDSELKQVNRALKFNPHNTELLRQKFTLLGQKVDQTEKELNQFKNAEKQLRAQNISETSNEFMKVRREIIEADSKLKHFKAELKAVQNTNLTKLGNSLKSAGSGLRTAGMYSSMGAAGMILSGKKLLELNATQEQAENKLIEIYKKRMGVDKKAAKSTMQLASSLQKQGIIGDEVTLSGAQQLATFAKMPGTVNKLLPAMDNLLVQQKGYNATADDAKNIANLFGKAMMGQTGALKRVGISFSEEQEKILKYGTEEEKAAMLSQVITENVGDMNKVFAQTDAGKLEQVKNSLGDFGERLGKVLLPALASLAEWLNNSVLPKIEAIVSFIEAHPILAKIAVGIAAVLAVAGPLLIFIGALVGAIGTITTALAASEVALAPIIAIILAIIAAIAALVAIGVLLYKNWDKIKAKAAEIKTQVVKAFTDLKTRVVGVFNSIRATVGKVWNSIKEKITTPIRAAVQIVRNAINKIKGFFKTKLQFPKIKLPHFKLSGKFSLKNMTVPHLSIKWYKKGAIFDSPTVSAIGFGEAGPEGIIPLSGRAMQPFAAAIAENMDRGGDIIVNVYGSDHMSVDELAQAVQNKLIQLQKRRAAAWA